MGSEHYGYVLNDPVNLIDSFGLDGALVVETQRYGPTQKPYYPGNAICIVGNCASEKYIYPSDLSVDRKKAIKLIEEANFISDIYDTIPLIEDPSSIRTIAAWSQGLQVLTPYIKKSICE